MKKLNLVLYLILIIIPLFITCSKEDTGLISNNQESELGRKVDSVIMSLPDEFPVLDTPQYNYAYAYLDTVIDNILKSDDITRKTSFDYKIRIIDKDLLHTFAVPGGYIYFYKGIIQYLDNGAQFAGILAHEVAHIDRRHTTHNLESKYNFDDLINVIWRNNEALLSDITDYLSGYEDEKFNGVQENEADEYAVRYLSTTVYYPLGIYDFYVRIMEAEQGDYVPEFLRAHPDPGNRFESINNIWLELDSPDGALFEKEYNIFKASIN